MNVKFYFGPLCPPLQQQLAEQGLHFNGDLTHCQRDLDAISRLFVRRLLTETETTKAWKRLQNTLIKNIAKDTT